MRRFRYFSLLVLVLVLSSVVASGGQAGVGSFEAGQQSESVFPFSSVELNGQAGDRENRNRGDGIILLTQPYTVIADIVVGNHENNDTSPGSRAAEYVGDGQRKLAKGGFEPPLPYYSQWNVNYDAWGVYEGSGYSVAPAGNGESYAIYRPTIGVPGYYEVFEWHGWHGDRQESYQEGTQVPHEIHHASGVVTINVNQQINAGQWNSLGTFQFAKGTSGHVKISNQADGYVIADAIRFLWRGAAAAGSFVDVPTDHPYFKYIEALYQGGYVAGCSENPRMYCPGDDSLREQMAVFVMRGVHGGGYMPETTSEQIFADVDLNSWALKWINPMWIEGFTAGCGTHPLIFCPSPGHKRKEAMVYFLRMMYGRDYQPPEPKHYFSDVDYSDWSGKWVDAAQDAGIVEPCGSNPLRFCPEETLKREVAAYIMYYAKGLGQ